PMIVSVRPATHRAATRPGSTARPSCRPGPGRSRRRCDHGVMRVRADVVAVPTAPGRHRRLGRRAGSGGPGVGVHRADVVAVHARRSHRPWHARPHEAPTRGVGPGTLATVVGLALVAGVGTGAAADRYGVTPASV